MERETSLGDLVVSAFEVGLDRIANFGEFARTFSLA